MKCNQMKGTNLNGLKDKEEEPLEILFVQGVGQIWNQI
jgi:hypothetical protein